MLAGLTRLAWNWRLGRSRRQQLLVARLPKPGQGLVSNFVHMLAKCDLFQAGLCCFGLGHVFSESRGGQCENI